MNPGNQECESLCEGHIHMYKPCKDNLLYINNYKDNCAKPGSETVLAEIVHRTELLNYYYYIILAKISIYL
jgi:hypothetical protein